MVELVSIQIFKLLEHKLLWFANLSSGSECELSNSWSNYKWMWCAEHKMIFHHIQTLVKSVIQDK